MYAQQREHPNVQTYKHASPDGGAITCIWFVARGRRSGRGCPAAAAIRRHGAIAGVSERLGLGSDRAAFRVVAGSRLALRLGRCQLGGAERVAVALVAHAPRAVVVHCGPRPGRSLGAGTAPPPFGRPSAGVAPETSPFF